MSKHMLIDATHPEETRVAVVEGKKLEEFDVEIASRRPLKGNIYLARVIRVEPSLQAAFVEYGGNRHGFLALGEIHPDYYRIPIADREALKRETAEVFEDQDEARERNENAAEPQASATDQNAASNIQDDSIEVPDFAEEASTSLPLLAEHGDQIAAPSAEPSSGEEVAGEPPAAPREHRDAPMAFDPEADEERARRRRMRALRRYKIQEVIKRRQVMLVQVTKEERGTKGAALTTYLSLAGRYCVLMPNTDRGGGISRRITSVNDRKRLKSIMDELETPPGMAVILRTAGSERSKLEVKRDYEYLLRLWDDIREQTLQSTAPCLIHEEANLIKRSIRDLYSKDIEDIIVAGDDAHRLAKDFMKTLIPSHAKRVRLYRDAQMPLFQRYQIESQIAAIHTANVQLKSGGYLVINQTEALVAIDVNSGRATRERDIEETALRTNLEAADEIARQLRLRDLAGLIVIDFIDMEEQRHNNAVERRLKDALRNDRARIQVGRISSFGLLEMSRQRLNPSLAEASTSLCPHCNGTGRVRSVDSTALHVLRVIEEDLIKNRAPGINVYVPTQVALYILNQKRPTVSALEQRSGVRIYLLADDTLVPPAYRVEALRDLPPGEAVIAVAARSEREEAGKEIEEELSEPIEEETEAEAEPIAASRRPGRADASAEEESSDEENADDKRRRRRRGRRGGRRRGRGGRRDEGDMPVSAHRDNGGAMPEDSGTEGGESPQNTAAVSINVQEESFVPAMAPHISSQATENETEESPSNEDGSDEDKGTRRRGWWRRLVE